MSKQAALENSLKNALDLYQKIKLNFVNKFKWSAAAMKNFAFLIWD